MFDFLALEWKHLNGVMCTSGFFFDRAKKTQGRKNSKLKEKTQNSSKKLKDSANFSVIYCKNQQKRPKNKGETTKIPKSRMKRSKH